MDKAYKIDGYSSFYYLLINVNGDLPANESKARKIICRHNHFDAQAFDALLESYKNMDASTLQRMCIKAMSKCDYETQVECVGWMINIAYSDSIMTDKEWKLIYKIYKELGVKHSDVLKMQKQLPPMFLTENPPVK